MMQFLFGVQTVRDSNKHKEVLVHYSKAMDMEVNDHKSLIYRRIIQYLPKTQRNIYALM